MKIFNKQISFATEPGISIRSITIDVEQIVQESGIQNGMLVVSSMHTTTAITINEFESRLLDDVRIFLHNLIPPQNKYLHNDIHLRDCPDDEPENAHSHLAAMLLSRSETIILQNREMALGQWQSIMLIELDGPRNRMLNVQIIGI